MWNEDGQPVLHGIKDAAAGGLQIVLSWILETSNLEIIKKEGQQRRVKSSGLQEKKKEKQTKKQKKIPKQNNSKIFVCCWFLCCPEELARVIFWETASLLSLHPAAFHSTHQTSSRFMPCHGNLPSQELCLAFALLSHYLSCSRLVTYLKVLGATCSCFLLSPTPLQMFQSLTWIPTLSSRWLLMLILKQVFMVRAQQEQGEVELCHHRNRIMKLEDIPRYLDSKWSHQKSPDLFNLQILYYTKIKKKHPNIKMRQKVFCLIENIFPWFIFFDHELKKHTLVFLNQCWDACANEAYADL